jgi:hypothetical protein
LGPSCWSAEGLGDLIDAGMNVARFNFSHGEQQGHGEVLERLRKVSSNPRPAVMYPGPHVLVWMHELCLMVWGCEILRGRYQILLSKLCTCDW